MKSFLPTTCCLIKPLLALSTLALAASQTFAAGEAKNVILFIGDGMGPVAVTASRIFKYGEAGSLAMDSMPRAARVRTYALDAQTPDSAPTMSAYTTGVKMRNDVIAMDGNTKTFSPAVDTTVTPNVRSAINTCPTAGNGGPSPTILEQAIGKGKATGVVSTARLTHATPAATFAHTCSRDAEYEIARQAIPGGAGFNTALGKGIDVLLGGISYYWRPHNPTTNPRGRPDGRNLVAELQAKGYNAATDFASFSAAGSDKPLIGLFDQALAEGHMSYELDRNPALEPSIAQMTTKAIDILSKNPNGYFLMVEGGRIDHALHGNNAKRALADTIAFDDAIKAALGKVDLANTLIVVTADHDHTMAFNGYSPLGNDILGKSVDIKTKKPQMAADGKPYTTLVFGNGTTPRNDPATGARADLTNVDTSGDKNYKQQVAVPLAGSETHGGGDVMLMAAGAGSKVFKGSIDNTKVFGLMREAFGF